jgi:hypothetical protein
MFIEGDGDWAAAMAERASIKKGNSISIELYKNISSKIG